MSDFEFGFDELVDYFSYLDDLRESGKTNMFGAGAWLESDFAMGRKRASKILSLWMNTFDKTIPLTSRVEKALES